MAKKRLIPKNIIPFNLSGWGINRDDLSLIIDKSFTKDRMENNILK